MMETAQAVYEILRPYWVVWLMMLFVGIIWWAFRPRNRDLERHGSIPLNDDD